MLMKSMATLAIVGAAVCALAAPTEPRLNVDDSKAIAATLDSFHVAASKADFDGYFSLFATDGVFLGTDATERWTVEEVKAYAKPHFDQGTGCTYKPIAGKRFITIADDGRTAWFDELLSNEKYGTCRGSGALRKIGDNWRIAQYNLSFMIPNDVANDVMALIRSKQK